ncbi:MAG TPA: OHCU decarboxylase, partial [Acinetobacter schindleri]|nr:OHCU decarboxylase [Acinetobacter schindleri]
QQRPFTSSDELLEAAKRQAQTWTWEEISKALATHPRIGEKQAQTALTAKEEGFSEREQASIS